MIQTPLLKDIKPTEAQVLREVRHWLHFNQWFVIRNHQGLGCHRGLSDLTAIKDGRVLWIEVKTANGRLSHWQEQFQDDISFYGGEYVLVRSLEDLIQYLQGEIGIPRKIQE